MTGYFESKRFVIFIWKTQEKAEPSKNDPDIHPDCGQLTSLRQRTQVSREPLAC